MDTVTRRKFLQLTAGTSIGAAAAFLSIEEIAAAASKRPLASGTPILVIVTLYGGNDGLNTVIPFKDPIYYSSRPDISYKQESVLQLDSQYGLNPSMTGIANLWKDGKVAIVRGAGYPSPDRSHFSSMAKWQSGSPKTHSKSGWVGRWIDSQPDDPMLAISLGSVLPPLLAGEKKVGSALPLGGLVIPQGTIGADFRKLSLPSTSDSKSSNALSQPVTEFGCQGLELDMAIVAWGNDLLWKGDAWELRKMRTRIPQEDPHQLRVNSYRVLLTRSREGLIVFIPPKPEFDKTELALLASGARFLQSKVSLSKIS